MPRGSADGLKDELLDTQDIVSAGPLAERVLSALVEEKVTSEDKDQADKDGDTVNSLDANGGGGQSWRVAVSKADYDPMLKFPFWLDFNSRIRKGTGAVILNTALKFPLWLDFNSCIRKGIRAAIHLPRRVAKTRQVSVAYRLLHPRMMSSRRERKSGKQ